MPRVWTPGEAHEALGPEEYDRRVRMERRPPGPDGVVLAGERANARRATMEQYCGDCVTRMQCGCFLWGPARDRLTDMGLRWDAALNLLPARPTREATWDAEDRRWATAVADDLYARAEALRWRVVLCGQRVCQAAGAAFEPLAIGAHRGARTLVVPHPSGLSRWWNDPGNAATARELFARAMGSQDWEALG